ncbi:DUF624 domain-containing protein [Serinibacter salmoneus]|uniref:Uncharacterized protein DUF624 n=1 Tax=Serinibacter salmoneus TaxID=556530 RepID=A0A2A9CXA1_9MICO|nr:DUF624 domain-containing protein [Serinibacter salmoneus]PFG19067.1 uncharacterized protein DUF624 [Serinibacter salmoneus]
MTAPRRRGLLLGVRQETWGTVIGTASALVITNALLALTSLPLLVLLVTTDPRASWPALAVAAVMAFPGLTAVATVFAAFTDRKETGVFSVYWASWRRNLMRSLALGALVVGALTVLVVDAVALWGLPVGAVAIPVVAVLIALVITTAPLAVVACAEREDARLREVLKASLFLGLRRWYLSLLTLVMVGMLWTFFVQFPALAVGLAAAPLLYGAWSNVRYSLRPVLRDPEPVPA